MSGYFTILTRWPDSTTSAVVITTWDLPGRLGDPDLLAARADAWRRKLVERAVPARELQAEGIGPDRKAPANYGLVAVDFPRKEVLHAQAQPYCSLGDEFLGRFIEMGQADRELARARHAEGFTPTLQVQAIAADGAQTQLEINLRATQWLRLEQATVRWRALSEQAPTVQELCEFIGAPRPAQCVTHRDLQMRADIGRARAPYRSDWSFRPYPGTVDGFGELRRELDARGYEFDVADEHAWTGYLGRLSDAQDWESRLRQRNG